MIFKSEDNKEHLILQCNAWDGDAIQFTIDKDDNVEKSDYDAYALYISTLSSNFNTHQTYSIWEVIRYRVKMAWYALCGKEFFLHELVLNRRDIDELKVYINQIK